MARKQNQKALYEAIRQGQAKIAQGLKTGQMRSDRKRFINSEEHGDVAAVTNTTAEDSSYDGQGLSSKAAIVLGSSGLAVIFGLGIWFGYMLFAGDHKTSEIAKPAKVMAESTMSRGPVKEIASPTVNYSEPVTLKPVQKAPERVIVQAKQAETVPAEVVSTGNNVIVIQGIAAARQDELVPLMDYFSKKGIETEVLIRNGYAQLVTKQGFDVNPESKGTPGYELVEKIRKLGISYPQETGDTKFGLKPFQDSYGLLK